MDRLFKKHKSAAKFVPEAIIQKRDGATFGVITLGGCDPAVREALDVLASRGVPADYMRVRGFPFGEEVEAFLADHEFCFVVEQNRDAQFRSMLILETPVAKDKLRSTLAYGGFPVGFPPRGRRHPRGFNFHEARRGAPTCRSFERQE